MLFSKFLLLLFLTILLTCNPSFNYEEKGFASYYNDLLDGRPTASGEVFSQDSLTAAHKSLPFGTKLLVTNLRNQRTIWVKVNDRGPFIKNRILDLSKSAADSLGMLKEGIDSVLIQAMLPE